MSMGAVFLRVGTTEASELGGLHKKMPYTTIFCIIGAASISAFPLLSGFAAKSLIASAAAYSGLTAVTFVLLFASAGVMEHSGIKIPYFAFFAHDAGHDVEEAPWNMLLAMGIAAALCIGIGVAGRSSRLHDICQRSHPFSGWSGCSLIWKNSCGIPECGTSAVGCLGQHGARKTTMFCSSLCWLFLRSLTTFLTASSGNDNHGLGWFSRTPQSCEY